MTARHTLQVHVPEEGPLGRLELARRDSWWRMANHLLGKPLLRAPRTPGHIKPPLLRHWGTTSGLGRVLDHLNRVIMFKDPSVMYVTGPGHVVAFENPRLPVPGAIERVPGLAVSVAGLRQRMSDEGVRARARRRARGEGDPAVTAWTWPHARSGAAAGKDS